MYTEFFGLNEKPFSISPDPRYLYLSQRHADALAHLIYGISESGGFIQLTGEVGTGKTTLIRSLLEQLPERAEIALILNPQLSTKEFLHSICEELRTPPPLEDSVKGFIDALNAYLLRANSEDRRVVLIVDEAQTLGPDLLEQVRLLTNLETSKKKLLQIILIGQPELRELLERPEMRQIAQRITGRYHLEPLDAKDTVVYVQHRLKVAGGRPNIFTASAYRRIYKESGGIPRLINVVADRALLAAYSQERATIDGPLVAKAATEVFGKRPVRRWWPWVTVAAGILAAIAVTTTTQQDIDEDELRLAVADAPPAADSPTPNEAPSNPGPALPAPELENEAAPAGADLGNDTAAPHVLESLLMSEDFPTDSISAAHELFRRWHASYDPTRGTACSQAASQQLQCMFLSGGSISELRRLNRPAMLTLTDEAGTKHHVVITGLGYDDVELSAGGRSERVDIAELTHYWLGQDLLLWKPVAAEPGDLTLGARNPTVLWLRESLEQILGKSLASADPDLFDDALAASVREFQRRQQLEVDGIVGAKTAIAIQSALASPEIPLLSQVN